ncbi:hypothetical protein GE115_08135 [Agromyces sp. CFH 90414]|uniref:DUF4430 domain-containing protein n=1 Tax=Agromyces agglutinans TaxID=2662258 RepID=A0A6I2F2T4_9MICO|nr:hypothetical protein [Agromyces agglutinans]MRG59835.1 hypothetical protein [Agromyces agglutinans]
MTALRPAALLALPLLVLALAACSPGEASGSPDATPLATTAAPDDAAAGAGAADDCAGVAVIVDTGDLDAASAAEVEACIEADGPVIAADVLAEAGVETEGTVEWGDQVVCRVNGEPAESTTIVAADGTEYHETCESMPAAFAYWALWHRPVGGEWGYAQEGLATLELQPGDAIELLFTLNDAPASPDA